MSWGDHEDRPLAPARPPTENCARQPGVLARARAFKTQTDSLLRELIEHREALSVRIATDQAELREVDALIDGLDGLPGAGDEP